MLVYQDILVYIGILLDNTHAILEKNLLVNGKGFIYADNATKTIINSLNRTNSKNVNSIVNNLKYFISQIKQNIQQEISNNSFYNFPNTFPLSFEEKLPSEFPLSSATGGGVYKINGCQWKTIEKTPGIQVSSPLINDGIKYYCNNVTQNGFFTNSYSISLKQNNEELIKRIFERVPKDLNGFSLTLTFGKRKTETSPSHELYDLKGKTLELPAYYNGNVSLYNSISGGTLYVHDIKYIRFYDNQFQTAVILSAVNVDNIQITESCKFFNKVYAKNCNFYIYPPENENNIKTCFFNTIDGSQFINCNIYVYGNYILPHITSKLKFKLINSHFSWTLKDQVRIKGLLYICQITYEG